jgi:AraC-like DNA-binding protein
LARALQAAARGLSLTDAAHEAGFADAAHFTRTMRRHFGVTPGSMLRSLRG